MPNKKFLRRNTDSLSKLGKLRKKLQKWRKPKGRDNKMRLKVKSRAPVVSVGYISDKKTRGKIDGKTEILVYNVNDIKNLKNNQIATLAKVGKRNKMEIAKVAKEKKVKFTNFDSSKFLEANIKKTKEKKE